MKKTVLILVICIMVTSLGGCTLEIPSLQEAREVVDAYMDYNRTGNLPEEYLQWFENSAGEGYGNISTPDGIGLDDPDETLE